MPSAKPGMKIVPADPASLNGLEDRFYNVKEVAEIFEASQWSVREWVKKGELVAVKGTTKQGHRIPRDAIVNFAIARYL